MLLVSAWGILNYFGWITPAWANMAIKKHPFQERISLWHLHFTKHPPGPVVRWILLERWGRRVAKSVGMDEKRSKDAKLPGTVFQIDNVETSYLWKNFLEADPSIFSFLSYKKPDWVGSSRRIGRVHLYSRVLFQCFEWGGKGKAQIDRGRWKIWGEAADASNFLVSGTQWHHGKISIEISIVPMATHSIEAGI